MDNNNQENHRIEHPAEPEKRRSTKKKKKRGIGRTVVAILKVFFTLCLIGALTLGMFGWIFMTYVETTLTPELEVHLDEFTMSQTSIVYYQDEETGTWQELQYLYGNENRIRLEYQEIPKYAIDAVISIEDERFETHNGVDWKRTAAAVVNMFFGMKNTFGGSTITQQVIKNMTEDNEPYVKRKVIEIFRAMELEKNYSKEEIMEVYLNKVYFGSKAYGLGAAAKTYFNKEASELTLAECASIVAITNNPSIYGPLFKNEVTLRVGWDENGEPIYETRDTVGWNKYRQETVLYKMLELEKISQAEHDAAVAEELVFFGTPEYEALYGTAEEEEAEDAEAAETEDGEETEEETSDAGNDSVDKKADNKTWSWFVEQVFTDVKNDLMEEYGYTEETAVDLIYNAGYRIYATVDPEIQGIVEDVYGDIENLNIQSKKGQQLQSGITVMDPYTGEIKAIAGKIGEKEGNRVQSFATISRPCGSAIKPLSIYAPALENGAITLASIYDDYPLNLNEEETGGYPRNSPNRYAGLVTVATSVHLSKNTTAVRILREMGASVSYDFMLNKLGFTTLVTADMDEGPMAMGGLTYGVNTMEMAAAFGAFANDGVYTRPRTYTKVTRMVDNNEVTVLENNDPGDSWVAMKETTAYQMNQLLKGVVTSGTGTAARISGMTVAGKTGTTNNQYDRYFVGYTPYYSAAVWVGYEYNETITASGNPAANLWQKVMSQVHEGLENKDFSEQPAGLTRVTTCTASGLLAGEGCTKTQSVLVVTGAEPTEICAMHQTVEICTESGLLATEYCPAECVELRSVVDYQRQILYVGGTGMPVTDPETGEPIIDSVTGEPVLDQGTPIEVEDSGEILSNVLALGPCTTHDVFSGWGGLFPWDDPSYVPDPWNPDAGYDPFLPPGTVPEDPEAPVTGDPSQAPAEPTEPDSGLSDWLNGLLGN